MNTKYEGLEHTWSCIKGNGGLGLHTKGLSWKHLTKPERQMFTSSSDDSVSPLTTHLFPSRHKTSLNWTKLDVLRVVTTVSTLPLCSGLASHECQQRYWVTWNSCQQLYFIWQLILLTWSLNNQHINSWRLVFVGVSPGLVEANTRLFVSKTATDSTGG